MANIFLVPGSGLVLKTILEAIDNPVSKFLQTFSATKVLNDARRSDASDSSHAYTSVIKETSTLLLRKG
jgi:hypothetical protein